MKTGRKIIIALALVYIMGLGFFSVFTYPRTIVNGQDKGLVSKDKAFNTARDNPKLTIHGRNNKSADLNGAAISFSQVLIPGQKLEQNQFLWPIEIIKTHEHFPDYDVSFSKESINSFLSKSDLMQDMKEPIDAHLVEVNGKFEIVEEVQGDTLDRDKAISSIIDALKTGKTELFLEDEYIEAKTKTDSPDLAKRLENANTIAKMDIGVDMGDEIEKIEGEDLLNLYNIKDGEFIPIRDLVYEYLRQLAIEYDTFSPDQERSFTTSAGNEIIVVGGIYGWQMDVDATTDILMDALSKRESGDIIPVYLMEGLTRGKDDLKDTYIEISIADQHLWFYKEGELIVETNVVTGDPTRGVSTHTGVGKIWSKEKDRNLVGIVPEGSSDYSSHVDFWMPINWNNEGIHNSKWRTEYGGSIYQGSGSYGCVNLPYDPTSIIFDQAELNTPVVVY